MKQFETKERMTEISRLWKELSDEEKASYNEEATEVTFIQKVNIRRNLSTTFLDIMVTDELLLQNEICLLP